MKKFLTVQVVRPSDAQCMPTVITAHNSKEDARAQMETLFHQTRRKYGTVLWTNSSLGTTKSTKNSKIQSTEDTEQTEKPRRRADEIAKNSMKKQNIDCE